MMLSLLVDTADDGTAYAVAGYAVILAAFFGYTAWIHLRLRRLQARLRDLESRPSEAPE